MILPDLIEKILAQFTNNQLKLLLSSSDLSFREIGQFEIERRLDSLGINNED